MAIKTSRQHCCYVQYNIGVYVSPVKHSVKAPESNNVFKIHSSLSLKISNIQSLGSTLQDLTSNP